MPGARSSPSCSIRPLMLTKLCFGRVEYRCSEICMPGSSCRIARGSSPIVIALCSGAAPVRPVVTGFSGTGVSALCRSGGDRIGPHVAPLGDWKGMVRDCAAPVAGLGDQRGRAAPLTSGSSRADYRSCPARPIRAPVTGRRSPRGLDSSGFTASVTPAGARDLRLRLPRVQPADHDAGADQDCRNQTVNPDTQACLGSAAAACAVSSVGVAPR